MLENTSVVLSTPVQLSREQILQATARCLRDYGYDATTIRKIAGLLGCAVGSIYRYFTDKRELLSIVTQQTLDPVAAMAQMQSPSGEGVEPSVRMYHQVASHMPETYRLMFWLTCSERGIAPAPGNFPGRPAPSGATSKLPDVVQQIVDGWATRIDAASARKIWAVLHGYVLMGRNAEETLAAARPIWESAGKPAATRTAAADEVPAQAERAEPRVVVLATEPARPVPGRAAAGPQPTARPVEAAASGQPDDVCLL